MISLIAGICQVLAWHFPGDIIGGVFGIISLALYTYTICKSSYLFNYLFHFICYAGGFYWLINTFKDFGGLNQTAATFLFILFCSATSLVGILIKYFYKKSANKYLSLTGFILAAVQALPVRIFPWSPIHPLLPFYHFTLIASIAGVGLLTILAFNFSESIFKKRFKESTIYLVLILSLGFIANTQKLTEVGKLNVSLIQPNIGIDRKNNMAYFTDNLREYIELSTSVKNTDLLIWAESAFTRALDQNNPVLFDSEIGYLKFKVPLLTGFLSYDQQERFYNSVSLFDDQKQPIYNKRILMPFGEYTPFAKMFPFLLSLNPTAAQFQPGITPEAFKFKGLNISPLICYEDMIPELAAESVYKTNANVLVSFSNDAWFGDTIANKQHNLIAAFRAVETQKYLIRSTNSGFTTIINTKGQTLKSIPAFKSDVLNSEILGYSESSFYTKLLSIINLNYLAYGFLVLIYILGFRR